MNISLLEFIQVIQFRASQLEKEVVEIRQELDRIAEFLSSQSIKGNGKSPEGKSFKITLSGAGNPNDEISLSETGGTLFELTGAINAAKMLEEDSLNPKYQPFFRSVESILLSNLENSSAFAD